MAGKRDGEGERKESELRAKERELEIRSGSFHPEKKSRPFFPLGLERHDSDRS